MHSVVDKQNKIDRKQQETVLAVGVEQASVILGIGQSSVRKLLADGKLAYLRLGRRIVIPRASIEVLLQKAK